MTREEDKAIEIVTLRGLHLRQAQDYVRSAGEVLRRAIRTAENAEGDLDAATQRLERFAVGAR